MKLLIATIALLSANASCPAPTPVPPLDTQDAGVGPDAEADGATFDGARLDIYQRACGAMNAAGCAEGAATCAETLRLSSTRRLVDFHVACLASATSKAEVRNCGPGVQCK